MRSCASLPYFAVLLGFITLISSYTYYLTSAISLWISLAILIFQPYKEKIMAISDAFMLANTSILSATIPSSYSSHFYQIAFIFFGTLPVIWMIGFITFKTFKTRIKTLFNTARKKLPCFSYLLTCGNRNEHYVQQIGDFNNLLNADGPERYMQWGYDSIS